MKRIAVISNHAFSLINFRGPLISRMVESDLHVFALAPDYSNEMMNNVIAIGAEPIQYTLSRTGMNPMRDLIDLSKLVILLHRLKPTITLAYFIKPIIYGSIAALVAGVSQRYSIIGGLGFIFIEDKDNKTFKHNLLRKVISFLYRLALSLNNRVIFLNRDDLEQFCKKGIVYADKAFLIPGTGVDLKHFYFAPSVPKPITFIFIGRMLKEKGVHEFIKAARSLKDRHPESRFIMIGGIDVNPGSIQEHHLHSWVKEGLVEWPGQVNDVRPWIAQSSVFVLPSYREGKPRSTQEAMAMGRPVITTDAPGCRDTVHDGVNGFLIPVRDANALARSMERFIEQPDLIVTMGIERRRLAETHYDVHKINRQLMSIMGISAV